MAKKKNFVLLIIMILCLCAMLVACGDNTGDKSNSSGTINGRPAYLIYSENGREVTGLADLNVTDIVIPDGITTIGWDAFSDCRKIKNVTIPDSVTDIGWNAFDGTAWLDDQPDGMVYAGKVAYRYKGVNRQDTNFVVKDGTKGVAGRAFEGCDWIKSITVPDSVVEIGNGAFTGCAALEDLKLPFVGKTVKTSDGIAYYPFGYVFGSTIYDKSVSVTQRYIGATSNKNQSIEYFLPQTLMHVAFSRGELPRYVFENCTNITQITIPEGVTIIEECAFYYCSELTNITIPSSVTDIEEKAFYGCNKLVEVLNKSELEISQGSTDDGYAGYYARNIYTPSSGSSKLSIDDKYVIYTDGTDKTLVRYRGSDTNLSLPSDITEIYNEAFLNCTSLTSITIPDSVTAIGEKAFYRCSALTSITIPFVGATKDESSNNHFGYLFGAYSYLDNSIYIPAGLRTVVITGGTRIPYNAFSNCRGLTSVTIPESVNKIDEYAFSGCRGLTSVTIPESVNQISEHAFEGCNGLFENESGVRYIDKWIIDCEKDVSSVVLRSDTIGIADNAFSDCSKLKSISIPESVMFIGNNAFGFCSDLVSIIIPANVSKIGKNAFYGSDLIDITFANTTGWYITSSVNDWTEGRDGILIDVTNSSINAKNLTDSRGDYYKYYLYKA